MLIFFSFCSLCAYNTISMAETDRHSVPKDNVCAKTHAERKGARERERDFKIKFSA